MEERFSQIIAGADDEVNELPFTMSVGSEGEYTNGRNEEIKAWVEEHPEIRSKIEERIRNVPAANRERAFLNAAKTEAMNQTVRPVGNSIRP